MGRDVMGRGVRDEWLAMVDRHRLAPTAPDDERYWSRRLETASRDELRSIQDEKLAVAVRYAYECIPFYRRKLDRLGMAPGDVRTVDDLAGVPVTTKQDMADDLAEHPPWGTYTAVDDEVWLEPRARLADLRELRDDRRTARLSVHALRP
jgi:phenylacetate-CoA ligase